MRYSNMPKYLYTPVITVFSIIAGLISTKTSHAQQYLYKKDRTVLEIIIIDTTEAFITYKKIDDLMEIHYIIPYDLVSTVEDSYSSKDIDRIYFSHDPSFQLSISATALSKNTLHLALVKAINGRSAIDIGMRYHGLSFDESNFSEGFGIEVGWRWKMQNPYQLSRNKKIKHILSGLYIKPMLGYSNRKETHYNFNETRDYHLTYGGLQFGFQSIIWKKISLDLYTGGYLYTGENTITPIVGGVSFPSRIELSEGDFWGSRHKAYSIGLRVGFLF